jgi:hypothetical protein
MERVAKVESLQEIIAGMTDSAATGENTSTDCLLPGSSAVDDAGGERLS